MWRRPWIRRTADAGTRAMCYMMSKQQYLNYQAKSWYPHLMFYVAGDVPKNWGANWQARQ